ncbi:helix-turn-helix transcriptional regulator [Streptomyces roseifaciens]
MSTLRFRAEVLTRRAAAAGDHTNYAIAQRTGLRESTISRLIAGRTTPSLPTLGAIATAYGTTLDDLVAGLRGIPAQRGRAAA